jgi:hypothetical protein
MNMKTKKIRRYLELISIACIIFFLILLTYYFSNNPIYESQQPQQTYVHNVSISINTPYWNISYVVDNTSNITAGSLLSETAYYYNISVEKEYWSGYDSYFITTIGNLSNGMNDHYWQYFVNDIYADKGCSTHYLDDNDSILWSFERSAWG